MSQDDDHRRESVDQPGRRKDTGDPVDFLFDGKEEWMFEAPYVRGVSTHGTGCTYSAAVAAYFALGHSLSHAVRLAKEFISNAIATSYRTAGHFALNTEWNR